MGQAQIHAVIVDYGSAEDSQKLSLALSRLRVPNVAIEVVHFDNGNRDRRTLTQAQKEAGVVLERSDENLGYAGAINECVARRKRAGHLGDGIWLLNSDLEVTADAGQRLWAVLQENPRCAAVGGRIFKGELGGKVWGTRGGLSPWLGVTWMRDALARGPLPRWSYLPGSSLMIRTSAFEALGGFPSDYFLYFEETEFCVRAQKAGWELWVDPGAEFVHHVQSLSAGAGGPSPSFAYYFTRGQFLFWKRNFGVSPWLHLPRALFVVLKEVILPLRHLAGGEAWGRLMRDVLPGLVAGVRSETGRRKSS